MTKWQDKNVGVSLRRGKSAKKPVVDERDGSRAGYHVEHWDDRQDAVVEAKPVKLRAKVTLEED